MTRLLLWLGVLAATPAAAADDPCAGLVLDGGAVRTARALPAVDAPGPAEQACIRAVGAALAGRGGLRGVTVAVRVADADRARGAGPRVGAAYTRLLAAAGVPEARISVVAPAVAHGEAGSVTIAFVERSAERPVARLDTVDGGVRTGPAEDALKPAKRGDSLLPGTWVATDAGAAAWISTADGSRLRVAPGTLLLVGRMYLDDKLRRVVRLDLRRGDVEADVRSGGAGSVFDIGTRTAVAGVRGTHFRLAAAEDRTRVETLDGLVGLGAPEAKPTEVPAGRGAALRPGDKAPLEVALLAPPAPKAPLQGDVKSDARLAWDPVPGAAAYRVDLARDAEFAYGARVLEAPAPGAALPADLASGKWFWRLSGVDRDGFVGRTSKVYAFVLAR